MHCRGRLVTVPTYQVLRGLDDDALVQRLLAGLPQQDDNQSRLARAMCSGPWHFRALDGGRMQVRRPEGRFYQVAGLPCDLAVRADAPFGCSCTDSQRHARRGVRCKHVWGRILAALDRVPADPAGVTDLAVLWGEAIPLERPVHTTTDEETTMSHDNDWRDRQYRHADETLAYPFIQWVNGGGNLEPRQEAGGFAAPIDQGLPIPGQPVKLHHRNGSQTDVIYAPELAAAVVKTRFAWVKDARRGPYQEGARGKLQALCYVQTTEGPKLAVLTFTGIPSRHFSAARKAFSQGVRKATRGQAPSWAFWMTVKADGTEMVGRAAQSPITRLVLARDVDPDEDYVGADLADAIEALLDGEADQWTAAWGGEQVVDDENGDADADPGDCPLPRNTKGYKTVDDAVQANDRETLQQAQAWAEAQGNKALADACRVSLEGMPAKAEIPF